MIYEFRLCADDEVILVNFNEEIPTQGSVFSATGSTGQILCGVVGVPTIGSTSYFGTTQYDNCYECLSATTTTIMANDPYEVCVTCEEGTFTVEPPHPVWTSLNGQVVIQENAVQLGGLNGLYS